MTKNKMNSNTTRDSNNDTNERKKRSVSGVVIGPSSESTDGNSVSSSLSDEEQPQQYQRQHSKRHNHQQHYQSRVNKTKTPVSSILQRVEQYNERYHEHNLNSKNHQEHNCAEQNDDIRAGPNSNSADVKLMMALGNQSYHMPGVDSWWDDLVLYFKNNHPIISICCHHPLHPIQFAMRLFNLFSSIMFGLCITNMLWIWYYYYHLNIDDPNANDPILIVKFKKDLTNNDNRYLFSNHHHDDHPIVDHHHHINNITTNGTDPDDSNVLMPTTVSTQYKEIQITQLMVLLWTVGSALHGLYDSIIWQLGGCICCIRCTNSTRLERCSVCRCFGRSIVIGITLTCTAIATFVIMIRASLLAEKQQQQMDGSVYNNDTSSALFNLTGLLDDPNNRYHPTILRIQSVSKYKFVVSYLVETVLAMIVYYPIIVTILFSGILGCGSIPFVGGRPYELKEEEKLKNKTNTNHQATKQ